MVKKPNSMRNLDKALHRIAKDDADYVNLRSFVANVVVGQLLSEGVIKGGSSLKMRFGDAATRYTTDLDAARSSDIDTFIDALGAALESGWEGFTGTLELGRKARPKDVPAHYVMQPVDVKLSYLGRSWCTVALEVGHNEVGDADVADMCVPEGSKELFESLGFPEPGMVPLMPLSYQVAQKIHALSEPGSKRAHDLIDLRVIMQSEQIDLRKTRIVCERVFAYRKMQPWPSPIVEGADWSTLYDSQADGLDVFHDVGEAVSWANELIGSIDAS